MGARFLDCATRAAWAVMATLVLAPLPCLAELFDRGNGLVYDSDQHITWLADTNYAQTSGFDPDGLFNSADAQAWASQLVFAGFDDWRLPAVPASDPTCTGTPPLLFDCSGSEMGHLFYVDLSGVAGMPISTSGDPDLALFSGLADDTFWSDSGFIFVFGSGAQGPIVPTFLFRAWAVRDGDVIEDIIASPDVTIAIDPAQPSNPVADHDAAKDVGSGPIAKLSLGALPDHAEVIALHQENDGATLLAFETTLELPGGLIVTPGDVARWDGASFSLVFDAAAEAVPAGLAVDAVTRTTSGDLVLSFDSHADLGAVVAADEDLVAFDGVGFALFLDGSAIGVADALDIDAASIGPGGHVFVSFDTSGTIAGLDFQDEDVAEYDPVAALWLGALAFDASLHASDGGSGAWETADLDALHVPEPSKLILLASGLSLLLGFVWHNRRNRK